jgi:hypothetical protein
MSLMIASAIFSAYGSIQAGKAKSAEARAQAEQLRVQKAQAKLTAMQEHNIRSMNLRTLNNVNTSFTGVMGRDSGSDRSLQAIRDRAKTEARITEDRARSQFVSEQSQRSMGIQLANMRASNARKMALINAGSTLLTAGAKYSTVAPNSTGLRTMRQVGYGSRSYST